MVNQNYSLSHSKKRIASRQLRAEKLKTSPKLKLIKSSLDSIQVAPSPQKTGAGRPTVMTTVVLHKLKEAFMLGCSDEEACVCAGISTRALYNYQKKYPEYVQQKARFQLHPILVARKSLLEALKTDGYLALKFLIRKRPEEFGAKAKPNITFKMMPLVKIGPIPSRD